jgi:hypothetical protein
MFASPSFANRKNSVSPSACFPAQESGAGNDLFIHGCRGWPKSRITSRVPSPGWSHAPTTWRRVCGMVWPWPTGVCVAPSLGNHTCKRNHSHNVNCPPKMADPIPRVYAGVLQHVNDTFVDMCKSCQTAKLPDVSRHLQAVGSDI